MTEPVTATTYTDTGLENEATYRYVVRAVRRESDGDRLRRALGGGDGDAGGPHRRPRRRPTCSRCPRRPRCAWRGTASGSDDVAAYAVYRAAGTGAFTRIATTPAMNTVYTDRDVRRGRALPLRGDGAGPGADAQRERPLERGRRHHPREPAAEEGRICDVGARSAALAHVGATPRTERGRRLRIEASSTTCGARSASDLVRPDCRRAPGGGAEGAGCRRVSSMTSGAWG